MATSSLLVCFAVLSTSSGLTLHEAYDMVSYANMSVGALTPCSAMDGEALEYLDRHDVKCNSGEAMTQFQVVRTDCSGNEMRFTSACAATTGTVATQQTACNEMRGSTLENLDRHSVDCGSAKLLGSFTVTGSGCSGNDMRFEYSCIDVGSYHGAVASRSTGCNAMRGEKLEYLDRHNVQCNTGEALVSFRVTGSGCGGNDMKFVFECVTTPTPSPTPSPTLNPTPSPTSAPGARGDPHLTSASGKKFDVNQPGGYTLVRVPADPTLPAKLEVNASLEATGGSPCGLYIQEMQLGGAWFKNLLVRVWPLKRDTPGSNGAGNSTVRPFSLQVEGGLDGTAAVDYKPWARDFALSLSKHVYVQSLWMQQYAESGHVMEAEAFQFFVKGKSQQITTVKVSQGSHQALDAEAAGLLSLGFEQLGGLLGTEGHDMHIENFTSECAAFREMNENKNRMPREGSSMVASLGNYS